MAKGFVLDLKRCIGCKACVAVCKVRYDLPEGVNRRRVVTGETKDSRVFVSMACNHCEDPACMAACPKGAISKDPVTGIVSHDKAKCVGCRRCEWACPYGAMCYDPTTKKVDKCDACATKADGPRCVSACHAKALEWVDVDASFTDDLKQITLVKPDDSVVKMLPEPGLTNPHVKFKKFMTDARNGTTSIT